METTAAAIPGNRKENPVVFYLRMLLYMFLALLIRVAALAPLAALFVFEAGSPLRWLALLCPVLIVFLVLPLRMSFAQAMVQLPGERWFSFDRALSTSDYGEKLGESLLHALHVLKWALPLAGMTAALVYFYYNTDLISLMQGLSDLGAGVTTVLYAVGNFFVGIFGGEQLVQNAGLMEGLYTVGAILGLGVLILVWGMVRNGAYRFIWVLADRAEKNPRAEARRRLRDRRWAQLGTAVINLILWLPALYVTFTTLKEVLGGVSDALFTFVSTHQLSLPEWTSALLPLLFAFFICYMPLLPIRRLLTCGFAVRPARHTAADRPVAVEAEPAYTVSASGAYQPDVAEPYVAQQGVGEAYRPNAAAEDAEEAEPVVTTEPAPAYRPEPTAPATAAPEPDDARANPGAGPEA